MQDNIHQNGSFPSDVQAQRRFVGEPRYNTDPVANIHGNPARHIAAPRVDRTQRSTMQAPRRESNQYQGTVVSHRRPPMTKGFEPKGHDAALSHCQNYALPIELQTMTADAPITGVIARRDRFTVTIEREMPGKPGFVYHQIIFKHAIESIGLPSFKKDEVL